MQPPQPDAPPPGGYGGGAPAGQFGPTYGPAPKGGGGSAVIIALIVVSIVVVLVGTLAVLAIYGVRRYIANAKTAEVRNSLGQLAKDAAVAYEGEATTGAGHRVCPSASLPVPRDPSAISGKKYQSSRADWEVDAPRNAGFACLRFSMTQPQYYQYRYEATPSSFTAGGRGDLNGDGHYSDFTLRGEVQNSLLLIAPSLLEIDPDE